MNTTDVPHTIDPSHWLPEVLLYPLPGDLMAVRRDKVTWRDLEQAREGHRVGRQRAWNRGWRRAYKDHSRRLARLKTVMETFAPLMQHDMTLGFEEACRRMTGQSLRRVQEL